MADRPKPIVRLLVVASRAATEPPDHDWVLRNPAAVVTPETDEGFPWREREIAVYTQLTGGMGRWELAVEFGQRLDNGIVRAIGTSAGVILTFGPTARLAVWQTGFVFSNLPFAREGLYEFRLVGRPADAPDGTAFEVLEGIHPGIPAVAELRALESRGRP